MINPNAMQVAEYDAFEEALYNVADTLIEKTIGGSKFGKLAKNYIVNNSFISDKIAEFNEIVFVAMKENGLIDGKILSSLIDKYKPQLHNFISIPSDEFRLKDIVTNIYDLIFGGV